MKLTKNDDDLLAVSKPGPQAKNANKWKKRDNKGAEKSQAILKPKGSSGFLDKSQERKHYHKHIHYHHYHHHQTGAKKKWG